MQVQRPESTAAGSLISSPLGVVLVSLGSLLLAGSLLTAEWRRLRYGWGGGVWLAALLVLLAIRVPWSVQNRRNRILHGRTGPGESLLLVSFFLTSLVLPLLAVTTDLLDFSDYELPAWATATGAVLQGPFLWLLWRSHADLGRNWSPGLEIREGHELVTRGVYRYIRHPMYAATWISVLAQPLLVHNGIAGLLVIPAFAAMWSSRIPQEEALMQARFGDDYRTYGARTARLFPWWSRFTKLKNNGR
jgi:protein-S-isoprenylcysteine O-methyltransferase Ste14